MDILSNVISAALARQHIDQNRHIFCIDFNILESTDLRVILWRIIEINRCLHKRKLESKYSICYNTHRVLFLLGDDALTYCLTVCIPYGTREKYMPTVYEINQLVDDDGMMLLAVCNNPYQLEALLIMETHTNVDKIRTIIEKHGLHLHPSKGADEIFEERSTGKWNTAVFHSQYTYKEFETLSARLFLFAPQEVLKVKMSGNGINMQKPKVFISYAHKDAVEVNEIVDSMELYGINAWIDKKAIDYGENLVSKIHEAMQECDLAIIFLSEATKQALFANHELHTFYSDAIYEKRNWFPIRIDEVDVDSIVHGLGNYLYYDFKQNPSPEELMKAIKKRLKNIAAQNQPNPMI